MALRTPTIRLSEAVAADAERYLVVIDAVLAMDYLEPNLRQKVLRLQRRLLQAEITRRFPTAKAVDETPPIQGMNPAT